MSHTHKEWPFFRFLKWWTQHSWIKTTDTLAAVAVTLPWHNSSEVQSPPLLQHSTVLPSWSLYSWCVTATTQWDYRCARQAAAADHHQLLMQAASSGPCPGVLSWLPAAPQSLHRCDFHDLCLTSLEAVTLLLPLKSYNKKLHRSIICFLKKLIL